MRKFEKGDRVKVKATGYEAKVYDYEPSCGEGKLLVRFFGRHSFDLFHEDELEKVERKTKRNTKKGDTTMKITVLDVKKLEQDITTELNKQGHDGTYHLRSDKYAMVENHKTVAVVDKELVGQVFNSASKQAIFAFDVYKTPENKNAIAIFPSFTVKYGLEEMRTFKTDETVTIPQLMGDRYQYNGRLQSNEAELVRVFSV